VGVTAQPQFVGVQVRGGELHVARWGDGPSVVLGLHGITGSSRQLAPIARRLGSAYTLIAPDLRGRGNSAGLAGPFGLRAHAQDCAEVLEQLGRGVPATVLGESMGGFVAVVLAAQRPDLVQAVVLADGGLPIPLPPGLDPDAVLDAVVGPAIARLGQRYASRQAYLDFWRAHPALSEEWNEDVERYLDYDMMPVDGGFRSKVSEEAVRADGADTLTRPDTIADSLHALTCPVTLVRAPRNLLNQPVPLIPDDAVADARAHVPQLVDEMVEDTNHYTLMLGTRGSEVLASHLRRR